MLVKQKYLENMLHVGEIEILKKKNVDEIEIFKRNGNGEIEILKKNPPYCCYKKKPEMFENKMKCWRNRNVLKN